MSAVKRGGVGAGEQMRLDNMLLVKKSFLAVFAIRTQAVVPLYLIQQNL